MGVSLAGVSELSGGNGLGDGDAGHLSLLPPPLAGVSGIAEQLARIVAESAMGQRRIIIDCDVIQADAGTRTASVTGSWLALAFACDKLVRSGKMPRWPIKDQVAGVSLGLLDDKVLLDMDYPEDAAAGASIACGKERHFWIPSQTR